jgi:hypothetical protein
VRRTAAMRRTLTLNNEWGNGRFIPHSQSLIKTVLHFSSTYQTKNKPIQTGGYDENEKEIEYHKAKLVS